MSDKVLTTIFVVIGGAIAFAITALWWSGAPPNGSIKFEIVKLLVQFLLVGVAGVVISLLVQNYNRHRDRELLINENRKSLLNDLIRAYSDTKHSRRVIMANRLANARLSYKLYDQEMRCMSETQLSLEILNHQIKTSAAYFGKATSERIIKDVEAMEKFLGDLVDEYKDSLLGFEACPDHVPLELLPKLSSTMGKENEKNRFGPDFVLPYRNAVKTIREHILH